MIKPRMACLLPLIFLAGCASKALLPGGESVVLSKELAPDGCEFLGEVQGRQGNLFTADLTTDSKMINGARNELRNAAHSLGANYVKIETESLSHNTAAGSTGGTHSAVIIGNAFKCSGGVYASR